MQTSNASLWNGSDCLEGALELTDKQMVEICGGKKGDIVVINQPIIVGESDCGTTIVPINIVITGKGKK